MNRTIIYMVSQAKIQEMILDFSLSHNTYIQPNSMSYSWFLRDISWVRPFLTPSSATTRILAIVMSCLDDWLCFHFFKKDFVYLLLERGEGTEKERERNINVWLPLMHPSPGTWPATQACALTRSQTGNPLVCRPALNPPSHTSQGSSHIFIFKTLIKLYLLLAQNTPLASKLWPPRPHVIWCCLPFRPPMTVLQLRGPFLSLMHVKLIFVSGLRVPDPVLSQFRCHLLRETFLELPM